MTSQFDHALSDFLASRDYLNDLPAASSPQVEGRAMDAFGRISDRVRTMPVQTLAQLRAKAEILWGDIAGDPSPQERLAFLQDLQRLTEAAPSLVFKPDEWLEWFVRRDGGWVLRDGEIVLLVPENGDTHGVIYELDAHGGREQVFELIRERSPKVA